MRTTSAEALVEMAVTMLDYAEWLTEDDLRS
jgi:hypothetical protein